MQTQRGKKQIKSKVKGRSTEMQNKGAADLGKAMPPITSTAKIGFVTGDPADPVGV